MNLSILKGSFLQFPVHHHHVDVIYPVTDYYYSWYNFRPVTFTVVPAVSTCSACPSQCPGTCGTWGGLQTCRFAQCPIIGNPCNPTNCARGLYLHPFHLDIHRYVQCETTPGVVYVRSCPAGLVFDRVFNVCSYPRGVVQYWTHFYPAYYQTIFTVGK